MVAAMIEVPPLKRDRDFVLFWSGQAVSLAGSAVTHVALPLVAVVTLAATPFELGLVNASVWIPFLGLPLLAGVLVDRVRKRPILIGTNAVRVLLLGLIPLLWWWDELTIPMLCAIAILCGVAEMIFQIAELAYVPALVGRDRIMSAYSGIEAARFSADLGGPGLAGILVQVFGPPLAMLADAVSYLVSTITLSMVKRREPKPEPKADRHIGREIASGLAFVWKTRPLRITILQFCVVNMAWQAFSVAFVLYGVRDRGVPPGLWGLVLAASGATAVVSSLLAPRVQKRLGFGRALVMFSVVFNVPILVIPAVEGPVWLLVTVWTAAMLVVGLGSGLNVLSSTLRASLTPDHMLGKVGASTRQAVFAGIPVGAFGGGLLAESLGSRMAVLIAAVVALASTAILAPLWSVKELPTAAAAEQERTPEPAQ
jgi:MFS family permease